MTRLEMYEAIRIIIEKDVRFCVCAAYEKIFGIYPENRAHFRTLMPDLYEERNLKRESFLMYWLGKYERLEAIDKVIEKLKEK